MLTARESDAFRPNLTLNGKTFMSIRRLRRRIAPGNFARSAQSKIFQVSERFGKIVAMRALSFPYNVYLAAFIGALLTSLVALPLWRKWCVRIGLVDDPGHRKIHDTPIPLAGGLAVLTGLLVPLIAATFLLKLNFFGEATTAPLLHGLSKRAVQLAAIALGAVGMTIIGLLDDKHELTAVKKISGQLFIAFIVATAGVRITMFVPNVIFHYAVTIFWLLAVINAFNFMDNMNGLCGGLGAIGAGLFGLVAAYHGQYLVTIMALLTCGAVVGFLPHNFPKSRAFLGDSGSHLVGYMLAVLAVLPHFINRDQPNRIAIISPLLILAVPLGDMVWVVLNRWRKGQPFYVGDTTHLSHRLVCAGLSKTTAVMLIWLVALVIGASALALAAR
jgi:UDP-GlcNAc:undecaprenyl-phosphate GlcNAc-1-phosphate transferase